MAGWRILFMPQAAGNGQTLSAEDLHPDEKLRLDRSDLFAALRQRALARWRDIQRSDLMWIIAITVVFFAIHIGRMPTINSWLGFLSPFVPTGSHRCSTSSVALPLPVPLRLPSRRITRPINHLASGYLLNRE